MVDTITTSGTGRQQHGLWNCAREGCLPIGSPETVVVKNAMGEVESE